MKIDKFIWQTFIALLLGFIILFTSAYFILNAYWHLTRSDLTPNRIANRIVRIVKLAKTLKPDEAVQALQYLSFPGIHLEITQAKLQGFMPLLTVNFSTIRQKVLDNPDHVALVFPLNHDYYLHIRTRIERPFLIKLEFSAAFLVWLTALVGFCFYIVRRLSLPLSHFIQGTKRFAKDINAPPLVETGPQATKTAFREFNRMQTNLKQLLQGRTQLLAAISHDLRTPVTRLQLRLENLPQSEAIDKMQSDLQQMEAMIQSLLTFTQNYLQDEALVKVDLNALLQSICDDMQEMQKNVVFKENEGRVIILGRMLALRRAFENLIHNGIKYGTKVCVKLFHTQKNAMITVTDNGPGISENLLEQVFMPFFRVDTARQQETGGAGLGLSIARDIIRTHGGDIQLHNLPSGGLQAMVVLPLPLHH